MKNVLSTARHRAGIAAVRGVLRNKALTLAVIASVVVVLILALAEVTSDNPLLYGVAGFILSTYALIYLLARHDAILVRAELEKIVAEKKAVLELVQKNERRLRDQSRIDPFRPGDGRFERLDAVWERLLALERELAAAQQFLNAS